MRVALVTPYLGRDGGVAAHVLTSGEALGAAGIEPTFLAARIDRNGAPHAHLVPGLDEPDLTRVAIDAVVARVRQTKPTVVHLHEIHSAELVKRLRATTPVVTSVHNYPGCPSNSYYFKPGRECTRALGPVCLIHMGRLGCLHRRTPLAAPSLYRQASHRLESVRAADAVVCYSTSVLKNLQRNGAMAPHLVPLFPTLPIPDEVPAAPQPPVVLYAGRVVGAKGLNILIRAMVDVPAKLIVCGDGWALPAARELSIRLGVDHRIDFRGWVDQRGLAEALSASSVLALPSVWPEPLGLVGLEAMAFGRPVVASNTGGVPDWLRHGVTGTFTAPGDPDSLASAISALIKDPDCVARLGVAARKQIERQFTAPRHVESLRRLYVAVAEERR